MKKKKKVIWRLFWHLFAICCVCRTVLSFATPDMWHSFYGRMFFQTPSFMQLTGETFRVDPHQSPTISISCYTRSSFLHVMPWVSICCGPGNRQTWQFAFSGAEHKTTRQQVFTYNKRLLTRHSPKIISEVSVFGQWRKQHKTDSISDNLKQFVKPFFQVCGPSRCLLP